MRTARRARKIEHGRAGAANQFDRGDEREGARSPRGLPENPPETIPARHGAPRRPMPRYPATRCRPAKNLGLVRFPLPASKNRGP